MKRILYAVAVVLAVFLTVVAVAAIALSATQR